MSEPGFPWPKGPVASPALGTCVDAATTVRASRLLLVVVSLSLWLPGCARETGPLPDSGFMHAAESTALATRPQPDQGAIPSLPLAPGTLLREADFRQTLEATGADLVVVQVYLESCGACMTEALKLAKREAAWRARGVAILGLGMDETAQGPRAFYEMTGQRITYPLYLAPWFARQQEVQRTPTLFIYSADGKQLFRTDGVHAENGIVAALEEKLTELLAND